MTIPEVKMDALQLATDIMGECGDPDAVLSAAQQFVEWVLEGVEIQGEGAPVGGSC